MIRPLHPDDAPALYQLLRRPTPSSCDYFEPGSDLATFQAYVELPAADHHRLVAVEDRRLIGLGILEQSSRVRMVHQGQIRLMMSPDALESDIGSQLLSALLDLADNWLNLRRLEADVPTRLPALEALLRNLGFETEGLMRATLGPGPAFDDELAMARLRGLRVGVDALRSPLVAPLNKRARQADTRPIIRPMSSEDVDDLYEMFRSPEVCRTTLQVPSQEVWMTRQRVLDPPPGMIRLVADYDGQTIGMITLRPRQQSCRAHIAGLGMMVHPDFWGLGIGSRLMEAVLDQAGQTMSVTRIELEVQTDNAAAIHLYEKFGFVVEGTKRFQSFGDGGWADTHFMARITG